MRGDQRGGPAAVLFPLDVGLVELDIADAGGGRPPARVLDQRRIAIETDGMAHPRRQHERESPPAAAEVEHPPTRKLFVIEQGEKALTDAGGGPRTGHSPESPDSALKYLASG